MERRFEARAVQWQMLLNGSMWLEIMLAGLQFGVGIALGDTYFLLSRFSALMLLIVLGSLGQRLIGLLEDLRVTDVDLKMKYRLRRDREVRWAMIHRATVRSGSIHLKGDGLRGTWLYAWQFESGLWERVHHRILRNLERLQFEELKVLGRRRVFVSGPATRSRLPQG